MTPAVRGTGGVPGALQHRSGGGQLLDGSSTLTPAQLADLDQLGNNSGASIWAIFSPGCRRPGRPSRPSNGDCERAQAERSGSMKRLGEWLLVALALAVGAGSCSDGGHRPRWRDCSLSRLRLQPRRGRCDSVQRVRAGGAHERHGRTGTSGVRTAPLHADRVAVTGTLTNGAVVTIGVADTRKAAQYAATVQDVAALDFQLRALARYPHGFSVASQSPAVDERRPCRPAAGARAFAARPACVAHVASCGRRDGAPGGGTT